jgi:uncharacterized lipoprotein YbaY
MGMTGAAGAGIALARLSVATPLGLSPGRTDPGRGGARGRRSDRVLVLLVCSLATVLLSACSSTKPDVQTPPSSSAGRDATSAVSASTTSDTQSSSNTGSSGVVGTSTSTSTATSTATAGAAAAVQAYLAYSAWVTRAAMNPADPNVPALAGLASGAAYSDALQNLNSSVVWKGPPATPRVSVVSVQFADTLVNLTDCTGPGTLLPYYVATGKPVPLQADSVPPPYPTTVQVVLVKGAWSVFQANTDRTRTCTP